MNWNKAYILILDKESAKFRFNSKNFHTKITTAKGVINWWHYIDNTYILIVEYGITAKNISDFVQNNTNNMKFFVSEINLKNHNGWLPNEAWDWINEQMKGRK